jgi:flagellar P-ring protein FlgI
MKTAALLALSLAITPMLLSETPLRQAKIRDLVNIQGVRENPLIGYGIVVGLNGTGDRRQTVFTTQMLTNMLQKFGVQVPAGGVRVNNVAAVVVTSKLPPFARPGTALDVTVSSIGDAKSLEGGTLLLTALYGPDGQVHASAQGAVTTGGFVAGGGGNGRQSNHPTVARISSGGTVERDMAIDVANATKVLLMLREYDFSTAVAVKDAVNASLGRDVAVVRDGREIELQVSGQMTVPTLLAGVENLMVAVQSRAKVVVNERTGTVVFGQDVRLAPVSILHGGLTIEVATAAEVSQPSALSGGQTVVTQRVEVQAKESPTRRIELENGAKVQELIDALQSIGATARDIVSILQAIKVAGGLDAELEVI